MWKRALLLSLALHVLSLLYLNNHEFELSQNKTDIIEVTVTPDTKRNTQDTRKQKTVVLAAQPPKEDPLNTDPAHYLSLGRQRVKQETKARQTGITQNRSQSQMAKESQNTVQKERAQKPTLKSLTPPLIKLPKQVVGGTFGDINVGQKKQREAKEVEEQKQNSPNLNTGVSMVNEALRDDVKLGEFTTLNTDQYLFYSFYSRIAPQIRFRWERNVSSAIQYMLSRNVYIPNRDQFVTQVEVILDSKGYLIDTIIQRSCGLPAYDHAVVQAFQESTPYLNPPKEMVQDDGKIRMRYQFSVMFNPRQASLPR